MHSISTNILIIFANFPSVIMQFFSKNIGLNRGNTTVQSPQKYWTRATFDPNLIHICIRPEPNFWGLSIHINK